MGAYATHLLNQIDSLRAGLEKAKRECAALSETVTNMPAPIVDQREFATLARVVRALATERGEDTFGALMAAGAKNEFGWHEKSAIAELAKKIDECPEAPPIKPPPCLCGGSSLYFAPCPRCG